eukprot:2903893-Prymnesium_polylepis.1
MSVAVCACCWACISSSRRSIAASRVASAPRLSPGADEAAPPPVPPGPLASGAAAAFCNASPREVSAKHAPLISVYQKLSRYTHGTHPDHRRHNPTHL